MKRYHMMEPFVLPGYSAECVKTSLSVVLSLSLMNRAPFLTQSPLKGVFVNR